MFAIQFVGMVQRQPPNVLHTYFIYWYKLIEAPKRKYKTRNRGKMQPG